LMIVDIDTAFLISGPVSRISEWSGFCGVSAAILCDEPSVPERAWFLVQYVVANTVCASVP
jgi:hypothetical protein